MSDALDLFLQTKKDVPEIRYTLPGSKEELLLRPFTTREQKAVLKALEKEDHILVGEAFDQLLKNCVINKGFKPEKLFSKDRECLLIKLRQESVKEEFNYSWKCEECGKQQNYMVKLSDLKFNELVEGGIKTKDIQLETHDAILVLGVSTREDEKRILLNAKKNSNKDLSQTEVLNGAYASIIKGMKVTKLKTVKNEEGEAEQVPEEVFRELSFDDRLDILEKISVDDRKKIKQFLDELEEYGYDLSLGSLVCSSCGNDEEHVMQWISFFIV